MFVNPSEAVYLWAGAVLLGLAIAWAAYRSIQYRRERGLPVGARPASPAEAAANAAMGQGREKSFGTYMLRLGLLVLAACLAIALLAWGYTRGG
jgi:hypothetical protein